MGAMRMRRWLGFGLALACALALRGHGGRAFAILEWSSTIARSEGEKQAEINTAQGEAAAILAVAEASAEAIRKIAAAIQSPGGDQAVQLKVAEKAVEAYAQLAQKNNTMIVPGNMTEVSALIASAMAVIKQGGATGGGR